MKNCELKKQTICDYAESVITSWMNENPYSNSEDDDVLFEYCLDKISEKFGDDFRDGYIYKIVDNAISDVISFAELNLIWEQDDRESIYNMIIDIIDGLVDVQPECLDDSEYILSEIVDLAQNEHNFVDYTDDISEDYYRPLVEKAIQEYKARFCATDNSPAINYDIEEMIADLDEYYECAGFSDFNNTILSKMSEHAIINYWFSTFNNENKEVPCLNK